MHNRSVGMVAVNSTMARNWISRSQRHDYGNWQSQKLQSLTILKRVASELSVAQQEQLSLLSEATHLLLRKSNRYFAESLPLNIAELTEQVNQLLPADAEFTTPIVVDAIVKLATHKHETLDRSTHLPAHMSAAYTLNSISKESFFVQSVIKNSYRSLCANPHNVAKFKAFIRALQVEARFSNYSQAQELIAEELRLAVGTEIAPIYQMLQLLSSNKTDHSSSASSDSVKSELNSAEMERLYALLVQGQAEPQEMHLHQADYKRTLALLDGLQN